MLTASTSAFAAASDLGSVLSGRPAPPPSTTGPCAPVVRPARDRADIEAYRRLRRDAFVADQALFVGDDADDVDDHPATIVLVAVAPDGDVIGGVRLAPAGGDPDLAWWTGSRLVVAPAARGTATVGAALVRAACATAEAAGALRFEARVQRDRLDFFVRLGWRHLGSVTLHGRPHAWVRWPIGRIQRLVDATKAPLAGLLRELRPGGDGWVGDDAAPVPGSDLVAACDAILPTMVERDPWWAGWCSVLVNVNDVSVKGGHPVGLLDAIGAQTASQAHRILAGLRAAADAWGVPVLGGHTTLGVHASLAVTALGRTADPVPAGGGRVGDDVVVVADIGGSWRPGYAGRQWDSTTARTPAELREQGALIGRWRPDAAKDVSMAGLVGSLGMLAEASGTGAELEIAAVPRPAEASATDWLTCFPGYSMVTAIRADRALPAAPSTVASARCGRLTDADGVDIVWPDGERITVVDRGVTGMGRA